MKRREFLIQSATTAALVAPDGRSATDALVDLSQGAMRSSQVSDEALPVFDWLVITRAAVPSNTDYSDASALDTVLRPLQAPRSNGLFALKSNSARTNVVEADQLLRNSECDKEQEEAESLFDTLAADVDSVTRRNFCIDRGLNIFRDFSDRVCYFSSHRSRPVVTAKAGVPMVLRR